MILSSDPLTSLTSLKTSGFSVEGETNSYFSPPHHEVNVHVNVSFFTPQVLDFMFFSCVLPCRARLRALLCSLLVCVHIYHRPF